MVRSLHYLKETVLEKTHYPVLVVTAAVSLIYLIRISSYTDILKKGLATCLYEKN